MEKYRWLFCHRIKEIGNSLIFPEIGSKKKNYVTEGDKENKGRNKKKNWPKKKKNCQNERHNQKQQKILGNN